MANKSSSTPPSSSSSSSSSSSTTPSTPSTPTPTPPSSTILDSLWTREDEIIFERELANDSVDVLERIHKKLNGKHSMNTIRRKYEELLEDLKRIESSETDVPEASPLSQESQTSTLQQQQQLLTQLGALPTSSSSPSPSPSASSNSNLSTANLQQLLRQFNQQKSVFPQQQQHHFSAMTGNVSSAVPDSNQESGTEWKPLVDNDNGVANNSSQNAIANLLSFLQSNNNNNSNISNNPTNGMVNESGDPGGNMNRGSSGNTVNGPTHNTGNQMDTDAIIKALKQGQFNRTGSVTPTPLTSMSSTMRQIGTAMEFAHGNQQQRQQPQPQQQQQNTGFNRAFLSQLQSHQNTPTAANGGTSFTLQQPQQYGTGGFFAQMQQHHIGQLRQQPTQRPLQLQQQQNFVSGSTSSQYSSLHENTPQPTQSPQQNEQPMTPSSPSPTKQQKQKKVNTVAKRKSPNAPKKSTPATKRAKPMPKRKDKEAVAPASKPRSKRKTAKSQSPESNPSDNVEKASTSSLRWQEESLIKFDERTQQQQESPLRQHLQSQDDFENSIGFMSADNGSNAQTNEWESITGWDPNINDFTDLFSNFIRDSPGI